MNLYEAISVGLYLLLMLAIGFYSYRNSTSDSNDFLIGSRKLGAAVTALSAGASDMSGWLLMGVPGAIYFTGLSTVWMAVGLTVGAYFNYLLVAPRLRVYTEIAGNAITLPVFFENRYKTTTPILKITASTFILIFFTLYTSAGMVAGGKLFETAFGLNYEYGLWLTSLVVVAYTFLGGFLAVSLTDFVQGTIMVLALIVVPIVAFYFVGSFDETFLLIEGKGSNYLDLFQGTTGVGIASMVAWGLGYFGQPHILVKFMAIENPKDLKKARRIGISWMILTISGAMFVGLIGIAYLAKFDPSTMKVFDGDRTQAETIFIYFSRVLFHPFIGGFLLSAILAAVMSTISSQLLVTSSSLTEDIFKSFLVKSATKKQLLFVSRFSVLLVALIALLLALRPHDTILNLVGNAWAGFAATFGPLILSALFNKRSTSQGAFWGMIVGGLTVLAWVYFDHPLKDWYELIPGFIAAMATNLLVSIFTYSEQSEIEAGFEEMKKRVRVK